MKNKLLAFGKAALVALFWLGVWFAVCLKINKPLLFPSPLSVLEELKDLVFTLAFWKMIGKSLLHILLGILLAMIAGTLLAVASSLSHWIYDFIAPFINIIRTTPVASFIILVLIWIGASNVPILICFLMVVPIFFTQVGDGIRSMNHELNEVCLIYHISSAKKWRHFYVPSVFPHFLSACRNSIGLAWKAGVAAEVLASSPGSIGQQLFESKLYLDMPKLFAWTLTVIVLSLLIEFLTVKLVTKLQKTSRRILHA